MKHVVTHPNPPVRSPGGHLDIHQVPAATDNLVWLAVHRQTRHAFAVDGPDAANTLAYCERNGITWTTVVNTHVHGDHVGINRDLERRGLLADMAVVGARQTAQAIPGLTTPVEDGDTVELLGLPARVWLTEGHINGHLSYIIDGVLFCGDTLFAGGCGYLFDGPPERMHESLTRLSQLPDDTLVCCAHEYTQDNLRFAFSVDRENQDLHKRIRQVWELRGRGGCTLPSTIGLERRTNPFLRVGKPPVRERVALAMPERALGNEAAVFAAMRALKDRKDYRQLRDDQLPL